MRHPGLIILAAGASQRMGRPKQLLDWKGQSFLRHACQTALATFCRPIVVVLGHEAEACARELIDLEVTAVRNADWQTGMGTSVSAGITALEEISPGAPGAMLMLIDQPAVQASFLNQLLSRWSPPDHPIAATAYPERGGVPAIFDRSYFPELRALKYDRGAAGLIAREKARVALLDPSAPMVDFDTPQAYEAAAFNTQAKS
jgi:molybdenum cofactor cytidylyltransferase